MDIVFSDFTSGAINGTGTYDKLMQVNLLHIQKEYKEGRIKGTEYATVYLGLLQASMQTAIDFTLREKELELRIEAENTKLLMDAVAQYGYNAAAIDVNGKLVLGIRSATDGMINKQIADITKGIEFKTEQIESLNIDDTIKQAEHTDKLLTTAKQRTILDEEKETSDAQQLILAKELLIKTYENTTLQVDTHDINVKQKDKLTEDIKISTTQKVKMDKETALLGLDDVMLTANSAKNGTYVYTPKYTI